MSSTEFVLVKVITSLVLPPGGVITLALLGIALFPFARRVATFVVLIAVMVLYGLQHPDRGRCVAPELVRLSRPITGGWAAGGGDRGVGWRKWQPPARP